MAETITLSGVPETMLQTVYARAKESRGRGAIRDLKAEEIIGRLDYDFSLADKDAAMEAPEVKAAVEAAEKYLEGNGRVLVRASGTEPLVRVLAEAPEESLCEQANAIVLEALEPYREK